MRRSFAVYLRSTGIALLALTALLCLRPAPPDDTLSFGKFGSVHVFHNTAHPQHVLLFVTGDGGWDIEATDMARTLAGTDSLVAGIDITIYLEQLAAGKDSCSYPAADFEMLSQYLQKRYGYANYVQPVLVGDSSGATLVYATLAQAPPNTFRGAVSLGFRPDLPLDRPMCRGKGNLQGEPVLAGKGFRFLPAKDLPAPWVVFQKAGDQRGDSVEADTFIAQTGKASVVRLASVAPGYSADKYWLPQFLKTFHTLVGTQDDAPQPATADLSGLPLIETPVQSDNDTLAVVVTGDGGWASIDRDLAAALNSKGIPVIGLDSLHYFWTPRTPEEMGRDMAHILTHYLAAWHKKKVLLVGYSRGADVLPFIMTRLPEDLAARVSLIALLGVEHSIDFELSVADWLPESSAPAEYQVAPEVKKLANRKVLCIYGADETDTICPELDKKTVNVIEMEGGHHFGGDYAKLAKIIMAELR